MTHLFSKACLTSFLGWDAPLLPRAAGILAERFARDGRLDLTSLVCVLPASRGTYRLDSLLRDEAERRGWPYQRPELITAGQLPERLYKPSVPTATEFEQTLAWAGVLRDRPAEELEPLLPVLPAAEPIGPWLELAATLRRLHEELSSSLLAFRDVVNASETEAERRRWRLLSDLFDRYRDALDDAGMSDPHAARIEAVRDHRCGIDGTLVLVGTSDLSEVVRSMLRGVDGDTLALVAAPEDESERFDEFGCVHISNWLRHRLPLSDDQLIAAGDISDQASAVAESLAEFSDQHSADSITVGVTDESQVGPVETRLRGSGVSTFRHLGWTVSQTAVGRLFQLTTTHLQRGTWQSLAALVRHADVCRMLTEELGVSESSCWLSELDGLLANHFPVHGRDTLPPAARERYPMAIKIADRIGKWSEIFAGPDRRIADWSNVIAAWLDSIYHDRLTATADESEGRSEFAVDRTGMALAATRRVLTRFASLNPALDVPVAGGTALETLTTRLAELRIVDVPDQADVEILGWLDLALDDAPAMVVVGLNQPFVPGAVTSDPFLPGGLRTRLRVVDNDRRYARDVYAMHLMLSTRSDIRFIVGRRGADQSPTPPSRLLAAAPAVDIARRIRTLMSDEPRPLEVRHRWDLGSAGNEIPTPKIKIDSDEDVVRCMSVTAFRDYLTCPYRFYLRHVLKLRPIDDTSGELAANQFGDLVHAALERFGQSPERHESEPGRIEVLLREHLRGYADEHYGDHASTAVALQIAQAERRLKVVAGVQAERIAAGWRIDKTEASVDENDGASVVVDGKPMGLRGRFDRIDYHEATDRWAILDYKTHGHKPEKKHLRMTDGGEVWIDLQLPLYRMMIPFLGIDADPSTVQLGYFNVSGKDEETRINVAEFTETQMRQAEHHIHDCVRGIRQHRFEPTEDRIEYDDYGMILQTGVASRLLDQTASRVDEEVGP